VIAQCDEEHSLFLIEHRLEVVKQHRVIRDGRVLFCRDELARVRYEFRVLRDYLDFRYYEDKYFRALKDRILREGLGARHTEHPEAAGQAG
jgi:hypothetical protein